MKKLIKSLTILILFVLNSACSKDSSGDSTTLAVVSTASISDQTQTSATVGGEVKSDGGASVSETGVYWGTDINPEKNGSKLQIGNGSGVFSKSITNLTSNAQYYVKAYAINKKGTSYGDLVTFTTLNSGTSGNILPSTDLWEGNKWTRNVDQGSWFPTIDNSAHFGIDDYSWGQIRTKSFISVGQSIDINADIFLNSGGINGDMAFFSFGDWMLYSGNSYGISFLDGSIKFYEYTSASGTQFKTTLGTYTPGQNLIFKITYGSSGIITVSGSLTGSFTPSFTVTSPHFIISMGGATVDHGINITNAKVNPVGTSTGTLPTTALWEGNKWDRNINQGSWFPTVDNSAHFGIDDYCWGQIRTKSFISVGQSIDIDADIYLNSGGINGDMAYFSFGDWMLYSGNSYGISFLDGSIKFYEYTSASGTQFKTTLGTYTPGQNFVFKITYGSSGTISVSGGLTGSFTPSFTLSSPHFIISEGGATVDHGINIKNAKIN